MEIGPLVLEKKIFKCFTIYERGDHLGHVTASCNQIFISLYLKDCIKSLVQIDTVVSEKIQFEILYVHDLRPRSSNGLDLQYSHTFIYSIRYLLLQTFRSLDAIVSEKSTVFTFSYRKAYVYKFDLAVK